MDREFGKIIKIAIGISLFFLIFGGICSVRNVWQTIFDVFVAFFPFICETGKMALEDYLTSPYFIVGVVMSIASAFGIWFGAKGGRILFFAISIICEIISFASILMNVI